MKLQPLEDRVIILQDEAVKETKTGLAIPETAQEKPSSGTIMKIGPGKPSAHTPIGYLVNGVFNQTLNGMTVDINDRVMPIYSMPFKEGDKVLFSFYAGQEVEEEGKKYIVMRFSDLIAIM